MLRTMMSPTCSSLTQAPISSWQRSASSSVSCRIGDLGQIELYRRVLAVDAVVERGQRLDLVGVGALVELDDALQHDLDGLADAHHLAGGVGERLARACRARFVERADSSATASASAGSGGVPSATILSDSAVDRGRQAAGRRAGSGS